MTLSTFSCQNIDTDISSLQLIKDFIKLPKQKQTVLQFGKDTLVNKLPLNLEEIHTKIFAKNIGNISFHVATVVASCNCTKVKFDKKIVLVNDSLGIDLIIGNTGKPIVSALTVVGNVPNGQKTIYLIFK